ncbi:MAG TPA: amidohydrolase family protein [bacterium]|nr:amidohydrolase family protein [bacterium]
MAQRLILYSRLLLTMDREHPIEDGFVLLQGPRILQVGRRRDLDPVPSARVLDLGDTVLLPGLINAHCHLDFTHLWRKVPYRGSFIDWLRRMGAATRASTPGQFRQGIRAGIQQSLAYGTTTLCDVSTTLESWPLLRSSGLRSILFVELLDLLQASPKDYWKQVQERVLGLLKREPPTPTFRWGLSPHTPFTVSRELYRLAGRYLEQHPRVPTTIHVAESREEARLFKDGRGPLGSSLARLNPHWVLPRNTTPVQYLKHAGWLPKLDLGVHLNAVKGTDIRVLAKNRVAVAHCPGSHEFFGHPAFPYEKMKRAGVRICLGTDSLASNGSLSLFREMRIFRQAHPHVPAREVLSLATSRAAEALGAGRELGRIRPGHLADLIGIPLPRSSAGRDPFERAVQYRGQVSFAMVHGELRFRVP